MIISVFLILILLVDGRMKVSITAFMLECVDDAACMSAYGVLADYTHTKDLESVDSSKYVFFDSFAFRPPDKTQKYNKIKPPTSILQYNRGET